MITARSVCRALTLLAFVGCGGSSGGSDAVTPPPSPPPPPAEIAPTIVAAQAAIALSGVGAEAAASVTVTPASATVTWTSSNPAIATVTGSGTTATIRSVAGGTASVVARAVNVTKSADATIAVTVTPIVRALSLAALTTEPTVGDVLQLVATIAQADAGAVTGIGWSSSNVAVATVDSTGKVATLTPGATTIVATSRSNSAATASIVLTVKDRPKSVTLSPARDTIAVSLTRPFVATVSVGPGVATSTTWRSSAPSVATVDANGKATAVSIGSTVITVLLDADTTVRATATLVVRAPIVKSLTVSVRSLTLLSGDTMTITPIADAEPGASQTMFYISSVPAVATVSPANATITQKGLITAVAPGTTRIRANHANAFADIFITVVAPTFPVTWTETSDGVLGDIVNTRGVSYLRRRPDGAIYGFGALPATGQPSEIALRSASGVWSSQTVGTTSTLYEMSIPSVDSAWVVGNAGTILRRNGSSWVLESSGTTVNLRFVTMRPDGTGYAGGTQAGTNAVVLLERSGGVWRPLAPPAGVGPYLQALELMNDVLYLSVNRNFSSVGAYQRSNGVWSPIALPTTTTQIIKFARAASGDVLFAGADPDQQPTIWRLTGNTLSLEYRAPLRSTGFGFQGFSLCGDGTMMATVNYGIALVRSGNSWQERPESRVTAVSGPAAELACESGTRYLMSGGAGLLAVNGGSMTVERFNANLSKIGIGTSSFAFVGATDVSAALRWDGVRWNHVLVANPLLISEGPAFAAFSDGSARVVTTEDLGTWNGAGFSWSTGTLNAVAVWGTGVNDLWAVGFGRGSNAPLQRYNGSLWSNVIPLNAPSGERILSNVHGVAPATVFAVGALSTRSSGLVVRSIDGIVRMDTISSVSRLNDVVVFSSSSAMAVGELGRTYRWNGVAWTLIPTPLAESIVAVTGRSINEIYAFTDQGAMLGFNGTSWGVIKRFTRPVRAARMQGEMAIAVGDGGMIIRGTTTAAGVRRR